MRFIKLSLFATLHRLIYLLDRAQDAATGPLSVQSFASISLVSGFSEFAQSGASALRGLEGLLQTLFRSDWPAAFASQPLLVFCLFVPYGLALLACPPALPT